MPKKRARKSRDFLGDVQIEPLGKRRRATVLGNGGREDGDRVSSGMRSALNAVFDGCLAALREAVAVEADGSQRIRSNIFEELPLKRTYKDYYAQIKNPISLELIEERINSNHYVDVAGFRSDLKTMFENARIYNVEGSSVFQDADELERIMTESLNTLAPGGNVYADETTSRKRPAEDDDDVDEGDDFGQPVQPPLQIAFRNKRQKTDGDDDEDDGDVMAGEVDEED
ncbi:hypothetical protein HK101_002119 [Irineochytrium annulatum]|nr:hypothetical protein HK101_002119 [Irineochytrium annulatum]